VHLTVGIIFAPTLNVPGPLISSFVEDLAHIFGPCPSATPDSPLSVTEMLVPTHQPTLSPADLRSPRKQMFSDLPTPAYNQTSFLPQLVAGMNHGGGGGGGETGMIPMAPSHGSYQMAPQGEGGYGSLNDALRSPTTALHGTSGGMAGSGGGGGGLGVPQTPRDVKAMVVMPAGPGRSF